MKTTIVLTAVGKDRPGIVAAVSKILYETGCNIEDSSMTILKGEFAMILIVSLPKDLNVNVLDKKLDTLRNSLKLSISLRKLTKEELTHKTTKEMQMYIVSVYGADKPGIVYKITQTLADYNINITDVNTKIAGKKKQPVYIMIIEAEIPSKIKVDEKLKPKLSLIAKELDVQITINPLESVEL